MTETFYVENANNGRFRRVNQGSSKDGDRSWRLPVHHNNAANDGRRGSWLDVKSLAYVGFIFLQGLLSGLSASSLYQATIQLPGELLQNSATALPSTVELPWFSEYITTDRPDSGFPRGTTTDKSSHSYITSAPYPIIRSQFHLHHDIQTSCIDFLLIFSQRGV